MKTLHLVVTLHANQCHSQNALSADYHCYRHLFSALERSGERHVLHVSGTLLQTLQFTSPGRVAEIRRLVKSGQAELLGSAYAQNVLCASSNLDNEDQLRIGREVTEAVLGVRPVGFWNPEGAWSPDLVPLLTRHDYEYTIVDEHILGRPTPVRSSGLILFPHSAMHHQILDEAVASRDFARLLEYYRMTWEEMSGDEELVICYAQDAEAFGLWQAANGGSDREIVDTLAQLLCRLKREPWLALTTFSSYLKTHAIANAIESVPRGEAAWMNRAVRALGYESWFEYQRDDAGIRHYRDRFERIRSAIESSRPSQTEDAKQRLSELARRILAARQFEFGCAPAQLGSDETRYNLNVPGRSLWEGTVEALFPLWAGTITPDSAFSTVSADIDGDGINEILVACGSSALVLTPVGGRILYAFDLATGAATIGQAFFDDWFGRWRGASAFPYALVTHDSENAASGVLHFRRTGFEDLVAIDGCIVGAEALLELDANTGNRVVGPCVAGTVLPVTISTDSATFAFEAQDVELRKTFEPSGDGWQVRYAFTNRGGHARDLEVRTTTGVSPDSLTLLNTGDENLEIVRQRLGARVMNRRANIGMSLHLTEPPVGGDAVFGDTPIVFGHLLQMRLRLALAPGQSASATYRLCTR